MPNPDGTPTPEELAQQRVIGLPTMRMNTPAALPGVGASERVPSGSFPQLPPAMMRTNAPVVPKQEVPQPESLPIRGGPIGVPGIAPPNQDNSPPPSFGVPHFPSAMEQQGDQDKQRLNEESNWNFGSKIGNPWGRGILRGLDVAGSILAPGATAAIPGSTMHHNVELARDRRAVAGDTEEQAKEAQTAATQAEVPLRQAETEKALHPNATNEFELWRQQNPDAPVSQFLELQAENKPETQTPFAEWKRQNPNTPIGEWLKQEAGARAETGAQDDQKYEQIEQKLMQNQTVSGEEKAFVSAYEKRKLLGPSFNVENRLPREANPYQDWKAQNPGKSVEDYLKATGGAKAEATAGGKEIQNLQNIVDESNQAHQAATMANAGNAEADVDLTLTFFKVMKGQGGSNIRFTEPERKFILGARSAGQGLVAIGQKVLGEGQPLTPDQRAKMVQVIDMHSHAAQEALDRMKGGQAAEGGGKTAEPQKPHGNVQNYKRVRGKIVPE